MTQGVGEKMVGSYTKAVIVESKPGAAGRLIVETVKASPTDGSALYVTPSSVLAMYPHVYKKVSYDPFTDFVPVSNLCEFVHGLAVGPAVPESVKTLAGFHRLVQGQPDAGQHRQPGRRLAAALPDTAAEPGDGCQVRVDRLRRWRAGVKDTLGGQLTAMMATEGQFVTFLPEGKLRLLATSGAQRSRFSPKCPPSSSRA